MFHGMSHKLRTYLPIVGLALAMLASTTAKAEDTLRLPHPWPAPVGHFQPRAGGYMPDSSANRAVVDQLQQFDAQQRIMNRALDQKLNVCRC